MSDTTATATTTTTTARKISAALDLPTHRMNESFAARRPPSTGVDLDPFLNVDLFTISAPVFDFHPHAGFSVVSYIFEDSQTPIRNEDSLGNTSPILPGGMHWTIAGSGIVHIEEVQHTGRKAHGAQIFVRLPVDKEEMPPAGFHIDPEDVPVVEADNGVQVRVVAGQYGGKRSAVEEPTGVSILDVLVPAGASIELPIADDERGFVTAISGAPTVRAGPVSADLGAEGLAVFEAGEGSVVVASRLESPARVLVFAGKPIGVPGQFRGGFFFSNRDRIERAVDRYRRGLMRGKLSPMDF